MHALKKELRLQNFSPHTHRDKREDIYYNIDSIENVKKVLV